MSRYWNCLVIVCERDDHGYNSAGFDTGPNGTNNYFKAAGSINPASSCLFGGGGGENSTLMLFDRGIEDSEYDIYNFSVPGSSGKFFTQEQLHL